MKLLTVPRAALDLSLQLVRLPVDAARLLLGRASGDGEVWEVAPEAPPPAPAPKRAPAAKPASAAKPAGVANVAPEAPPRAPVAPPSPPSENEIAARAFELYEQGVPGGAQSHWDIAERELGAPARRS